MIDTIYKTLLTILNKENQGYVSPQEFDLIANNVQNEIFREYFENINRDKIKENKNYSTQGYGNLNLNERQRIDRFASIGTLTVANSEFTLPNDLYFIEDMGVTTNVGNVIEEVEKHSIGYLLNSISSPTVNNPIYEKYGDKIKVYPDNITDINLRYLRSPKVPKWTYFVTPNGSELFNPSNPSFQDFDLHESEFTNIINRMLMYFGINLREADIVQVAQSIKEQSMIKEEN